MPTRPGTVRLIAAAAAAGLLASLSPFGAAPAPAAIGAKRVVRCEGGGECWPAAFAFTPNGRTLFYAERLTGEIRARTLKTGKERRWHLIGNLSSSGEQGVLGIAVDPAWPAKRWIYVYYTHGTPTENRIVRIRKGSGKTIVRRMVSIPANTFHNGGVIHFGPDGRLYAVTGDAQDPARSQDTGSPAGKVLRMTRMGKRPADNPFPGSLAYSFGHRNSFGFAFHPETGDLWQSENGPECDDEVNLVLPGRNYGWGPGSACPNTSTAGPDPTLPEVTYTPVIAPTGATFCDGCGLGGKTEGALLFGSFGDERIRRLRLTADRMDVASQTILYEHGTFILAVESAPNGQVFFSDSRGIFRLRR